MIDDDSIRAILDQYSRHGWTLRRVLLTVQSTKIVEAELKDLFANADIRIGSNNALWFSRRSEPDREAWELRRLSATPYALVEVVSDDLDPVEKEERLRAVEEKMFEAEKRPEMSH